NLTSTVQLLTGFDQYNRISAIAKRDEGKDVFGLIEKYDVENDSLVFKVIEDSKEELKKGEKIVSSNVGGSYPANLLIGEIEEDEEASKTSADDEDDEVDEIIDSQEEEL